MNSTKTSFTVALLFLFLLIGAFSYEMYAVLREDQVTATLAGQAAAQTNGRGTLDMLRSIQSTHAADLTAIDSFIVTKDNPVPFLDAIEQVGESMGLKVQTTSVTVDQPKGSPTPMLHVSLSAQGAWTAILAFVEGLQSMPYQVIFNDISLTVTANVDPTTGKERGAPVWQLTAALSLNVQK